MSRKPLIAGNWKMNLNHFEAIALVQKIAFSLPDKYFDKVDVAVIPPFTDLLGDSYREHRPEFVELYPALAGYAPLTRADRWSDWVIPG